MPTIKDYIDKLIELKNDFAKNLSKVGSVATNTEKYNSLIAKVANIPIDSTLPLRKGEEIVLNNKLSEKKTIIDFEYPDVENLARYRLNETIDGVTYTINDNGSITMNGTSGSKPFFMPLAKGKIDFVAGEIYSWDLDTSQSDYVSYCFDGVIYEDAGNNIDIYDLPATGEIVFNEVEVSSYLIMRVKPNMILNNVTIKRPILYKQRSISLNLESKNLFRVKPFKIGYDGWSGQIGGITRSDEDGTITFVQPQNYDLRVWRDGVFYPPGTYTISSSITSGGFSRPYIKLSADGNRYSDNYLSDSDIEIQGLNYNSKIEGWFKDSTNGFTFTVPETVPWFYIGFYPTGTAGETYTISNIQLEIGSTATDYTSYVSDFSASKVYRYGKNLFDMSLILPTDYFDTGSNKLTVEEVLENGYIVQGKKGGSGKGDGVWSNGWFAPCTGNGQRNKLGCYVPAGATITWSYDVTLLEKPYYPDDNYQYTFRTYNASYSSGSTQKPDKDFIDLELGVKKHIKVTGVNRRAGILCPQFTLNSNKLKIENIQLEIGNTGTNYNSFIKTEYTPNSSGTIINIPNHYPITRLAVNNNSVVIGSATGVYKHILPNEDKNCFIKVWQPIEEEAFNDV